MEGRRGLSEGYSRRLPPPEAWKNPAKWIDLSTGLARMDASKLVLPTDHRGFVKPDEALDYVLDYFFWNDYDWPYSNDDPETAPDRHHFLHRSSAFDPIHFDGNRIPSRVRDAAPNVGLVLRQPHNVLHDYVAENGVPELDAMTEWYNSWLLAHRALSRLVNSAKGLTQASSRFNRRAESIKSGIVLPPDPNDAVAKAMMVDFFKRHFTEYGLAIEDVLKLEGTEFAPPIENIALFEKPHLVVKKLGNVASRSHVNLLHALKAA